MKTDDPWTRASIEFHTRPNKAPRDITRDDLIMPRFPSNLKMLGVTLFGGMAMALMYVWPVLTIVAILTGEPPSAWYWGTLLISAVVLWLSLFWLAVRESEADKRYVEQL